MSIKVLEADLNVLGAISENGVALKDKYVSKDEEVLTQEVICSHFGEITGNTNDEHGLAIEDQQMIISKIEGQTLIANNLIDLSNKDSQTINGVTFTVDKTNGTVIVTGSGTIRNDFVLGGYDVYKGHKYLFNGAPTGSSSEKYFSYLVTSNTKEYVIDYGEGGVLSATENERVATYIATENINVSNVIFKPQLIDLTLMFGHGNEPTLDEWKAMNMPLIPCSTGHVLNSKANLLSTTKNVCPRGQWILGERYDYYTGDVVVSNMQMTRFDAKIYVTNNIKYYLWSSKSFSTWRMYCYDSNDKYLGLGGNVESDWGITPLLGTSYIRIVIWTDPAIDDGSVPAEYNVTPFERITESLPYQESNLYINEELSKFEYIDNYTNNKHSRLKSIDLGTVSWYYAADTFVFYTVTSELPNIKKPASSLEHCSIYCSRYATTNASIASNKDTKFDKSIGLGANDVFYLNDYEFTDPTQLKAALSGVILYYESNEEVVTPLENLLPDGMPVWNGGQQSQIGQLPYILNKQYSLSLSAQVAANIQIDKEQQIQINNLYDEVSNMESYIDNQYEKMDNQYEKMTNHYIGHPEGGDAWFNTSANIEVGAICIRIPYIPYGGHIKFKTSIADVRHQSSADYIISFTFSSEGHVGNIGAYCITALENQTHATSTQLYNLIARFSNLEEGYFYIYLGEIDKQWNCPTVSISDVTFFTWATADADILRKNWAITLETAFNHNIEHSTSKTGLYVPKRTDYTLDEIGMPNSSINPPFTVQPFLASARAMRLFGLPADQIIIEHSTDGGVTWVDAQYEDAIKTSLFNQSRSYTPVIPLKNGVKSCDCLLRITITAMKYNVPENTPETDKYNYWNAEHVRLTERYCTLDFGYFWINANADAMYIEHQHALAQDPNTWITDGVLSNARGWSGGNYIKFSSRSFGGNVSQLTNSFNHRFIFRTQATDGSFNDSQLNQSYLSNSQYISEISCYGQNCWIMANEMMESDRPYKFDSNMNCIFESGISTPANIWATENISSGSYIAATGHVSAKDGFVFTDQPDADKKLLRADGWWQSVSDFATADHTHSNYASTSYVDTACNGVYSQVSNELTPINNKLAKVSMDATNDTLTISSTTLNLSGNTIASSLESDEIKTPTLEAEKVHTNSLTILTADPNNANSTIIAGTIQPEREPQQGYGSNGHILNISPLYSSIITTPHLYLSSSDYSAALTYDNTNKIINCGVQFKAPSLTVTDSVKIGNSVLQNDQIQGFSSVNEALISNMPINASSFLADNSLRITSQGFETTISNTANGAEQSLHIDHSLTVAGKLSVQDRIDAASIYVDGAAVATKKDTSFALLSSTSAPGAGGTLIGSYLANYNDVMFIIENHHTQPVTVSIAYADNNSAVTALTYTVPANTNTAISAYRCGTTGGIFTVAGVVGMVTNIIACRLITNLSTASIKLSVVGR